ncbi:MAG: sugar phosphate isomerase/epimerase [Treponema sp.]|nr:sugar phosphate isomerase/epimerase [Treponema sp.]
MRIGTMTSHFRDQREAKDLIGYVESMNRCVKAGFTVLDMNLCALQRGGTELNGDDWREKLGVICKEKEKLKVEFVQSHPPYRPFFGFHFPTPEEDERFRMLTKRSIEVSAALGVTWAVMHPVTETAGPEMDTDLNLAANHVAYDEAVEFANKRGVGIAFENLTDVYQSHRRRFGTSAEELLALIESYRGAKVGVCWDTGHANRVYADQIPAITRLGRLIKATHINDNMGGDDLHLMPFLGTVPWEGVIKAFKDSGYEGDLIYEITMNNRMPQALKDPSARYSFDIGRYLLCLAE